jgi:predicted CXXCH cytochrome family protein
MHSIPRASRLAATAALIAIAASAACVDENVTFPDRDNLARLAAAAGGFLGYSQPAAKLTVCGNCHVGQQQRWETTAHAGAWSTLAASPGAQAFCEGCHTLSERGNELTGENAGWLAVRDPRLQDVQCESCHGPGVAHVRNPSAVVPHASIQAAVGGNDGCGECHSGAHHPFVEEWTESRHGRVQTAAVQRAECRGCHGAQYALQTLDPEANYDERGSDAPIAITCAICHDPHGAEHEGQLRLSISVPSEEENLCMRCHQKRGQPDPTTFRGPHAPEGPLLLGDAGWWPPNMPLEPGERIATTHGSIANPRLCAGCHVNRITVEDALTGQTMTTAGHLFQATPCLDEQGRPTSARDCAEEQRSFQTCATSGCHASESAARNALATASARITRLVSQLNAQLAQVPASEFSDSDNIYTTAEGARFNVQLALFPGSVIHNPFLIEALLTASIQQVQREYGIAPPPATQIAGTAE